jgi:hypothetical protein
MMPSPILPDPMIATLGSLTGLLIVTHPRLDFENLQR